MLNNKDAGRVDFINTVDGKPVATKNVQKDTKPAKKKDRKPNFFTRLGGKIKDTFSELKKVTWPTFPKVLKQTGIVLLVVLIFLVVISAFNYGLSSLLSLIHT